jgi:carboxymethylenebutenolidase
MKAAGKTFDWVTYDGAGHGFMRAGEDPGNTDSGNMAARDRAMTRLLKLLGDLKGAPKADNSGARPIVGGKKVTAAAACHPADKTAAM